MFCWCALAMAMVVGPAAGAKTPPRPAVGQKVGYFNMAKVMRDYDKAKTRVAQLNEQKTRMEAKLVGLRGMLTELRLPGAKSPVVPASGTESHDAIKLARLVEDADRDMKAVLEKQARGIVSEVYDEIHAAAVAMSKEHGLSALIAYPDAVTDEEKNSPMIKELKLKPPAAQPFYLHPSVDYTDELLLRLNGKGKALPPRPASGGEKTGYFNMAAIMRDFGKAKYEVYMLNQKRNDLSRDLISWRARYIKLQQDIQNPRVTPEDREQMSKEMLKLARKIEDKDQEVNKALNDDATKIIAGLYDDIHTVVSGLAKEKGLSAVLAYPDAVTEEERNSAMIKELKLKPPGAQPFYLDPAADYTGEVIKRLNASHSVPGVPAPPVPSLKPADLPPIPKVDSGTRPLNLKPPTNPNLPSVPAVNPGKP